MAIYKGQKKYWLTPIIFILILLGLLIVLTEGSALALLYKRCFRVNVSLICIRFNVNLSADGGKLEESNRYGTRSLD